MSRNEKKRKRGADQDGLSSIQPSKAQKVENSAADYITLEESKPSKKEKKGDSKQKKSERKSKREIEADKSQPEKNISNTTNGAEDGLASGHDFISLSNDTSIKRSKKDKKPSKKSLQNVKGISPRMQRKRRQAEKQEAAAAAEAEANGVTESTTPPKPAKKAADKEGQHKSRFIVFVGNLPYDATTEQVSAHFAKLQPASVRHQTDKKTGKGKGFAFLEFTNYDRMKTCLQLYHHSIFDPHGTSEAGGETDGQGEKKGRKLNVELTAGGGGKGEDRKGKIKEKNKKLSEQRERSKVKQLKKKADAERKRILKAEKEARNGRKTGANAQPVETPKAGMGDIHPSRMARVHG